MTYHEQNRFEFLQTIGSDGTCQVTVVDDNSTIKYYVHAAFMWTTWALIGLSQIFPNRYARHHWRWNKIAHAILGWISLAFILTGGFIALKTGGWTINSESSMHAKFGFATMILGIVLMLGGVTSVITRLKLYKPW